MLFHLCGICKVTGLHPALGAPGELETTWNCVENSKEGSTDEQKLNISSMQSLKICLLNCLTKSLVSQL